MAEKGLRLTIITVCYNEINGIQRTIDSIINQTWQHFEWIVIDGGSTDGTYEKFLPHRTRISSLITGKDRGIYHAMNKGVALAEGEYLLFLNGGDHFTDNQSIDNAMSMFDYRFDINYCPILLDNKHLFNVQTEVTPEYLYKRSMPHGGSFIKAQLLKERPYDESFKIAADYDFFAWAKLKRKATIHLINHPLSVLYLNGISSTNLELLQIENRTIREKYFNMYQKFILNETNQQKIQRVKFLFTHPRYVMGAIKLNLKKTFFHV